MSSDQYDIIIDNGSLMPEVHSQPADYTGAGTRTLDRDATVDDICDFIVEYINSDVLVGIPCYSLASPSLSSWYRVCSQINI